VWLIDNGTVVTNNDNIHVQWIITCTMDNIHVQWRVIATAGP